jgi:dGTPase
LCYEPFNRYVPRNGKSTGAGFDVSRGAVMNTGNGWAKAIGHGYCERAPYACLPEESRGRFYGEPESRTRSCFQRDRDRIIHSTAFRRLKHKTQVFVSHEGDHYRTRLTHSIEVSQIARALARALRLDEELAEALALVHDFGHTPFGHTGEDVLAEKMAPWGGFDHNAQSLRIVTKLERRYAEFEGLNLTWETLEGLVKHNGPLEGPSAKPGLAVHQSISDYCALHDLELASHAGLEAQAAAISDDIAYNTHDIDDGLRAGLFSLDALEEIPFAAEILREVREHYPHLDAVRSAHEFTRRQITRMVEDVISTSLANLAEINPQDAVEVRQCGRTLVCFSPQFAKADKQLKAFLFAHMYRHPDVVLQREKAGRVVAELFDTYFADPAEMPHDWSDGIARADEAVKARGVCDFLAGMTDNYAIGEHRRLFDRAGEFG